jgi:predicted neutral ceramidase superfamily lipid hydrolase
MFGSSAFTALPIMFLIIVVMIAVVTYVVMLIIRRTFKSGGIGSSAVHGELVRVNERLNAIEKLLKDID